ncbi:MAG: DMT family transporter [Burkholderiales bacterium]
MTAPQEHRRAVMLMIGATLCWASAGVLVRSMNITDAWEITFWRSVFLTLSLGAWLWFQHRGAFVEKVVAVGVPGLLSGALLTVMFVGFIVAMTQTTVANTLIVVSSAPFFAALFGWLMLREAVPPRTWLAMAAAMAGIGVMFGGAVSHDRWIGVVVALIVPVGFGLNIVLLRRMRAAVDMIPAILLAGVISAILTLPFALPFEAGAKDLGLLAIMGAVQVGLGCVLMVIASRHLSAAEIGLTSILETIFGTLAVWALIGERPSEAALLGGLMVITALAANQAVAFRGRRLPA